MAIVNDKLGAVLKEKGIKVQRLREDKVVSQAALTNLRHNIDVIMTTVNALCSYLCCQPGDIMRFVPDSEE